MKILVTGGRGMLATEIRKKAPEGTLFCDISDIDITDIASIRTYIAQHQDVDVIINCAAGRDAEVLEENPEQAEKIAIIGPRNLAIVSREINAILIHISSDYVFDGKKGYPYIEEDETNALSVYGKTKVLGEKEVLKYAKTGIVFRTAWLLSAEGNKSFVKTIATLAQQRSELNVVFDQIGSPTSAADLAGMILSIVPQIKEGTKEIFHLTNEGVASWYDIAVTIVSELGLPCHINPIHSFEYPTKAKRPFYSVLDKTKVKNTYNIKIRHYSEGLKECLSTMKNH